MAVGLGGLIGDIIDPMIRKTLTNMAARLAEGHPDITPAMQATEVNAAMIEIQEGLDIWKSSQPPADPGQP